MKKRNRIVRIVLLSLVGLLSIVIVGGLIATRYLERKAKEELAGQNITCSKIDISLLTSSFTVNDVAWSLLDDSLGSAPHNLTLKRLKGSGVSVYQFVRNKTVKIRKLSFEDGDLRFNRQLKTKRSQSDSTKRGVIKGISIDALSFKNIQAKIVSDTTEEYSAIVDLQLNDVALTDLKKVDMISSYRLGSFETSITKIKMNEKEGLYKTKVSELYANSVENKIIIDSISLTPKYSKYRFSRKLGKQVDRFTLAIPQLTISGFEFSRLKDSLFIMGLIEIDYAKLHVYRDKRLPFIKDKNTPLPIAMIRSLPVEIAVDSIRIKEAKITYEEFPEEGFRTGQISFEHLNATIDHVSNRNHYPNYEQSTVKVRSRVMAKGTIDAEFSLPYGKKQIYNAKGVIKNLSLYRLNPILESVAFISVESGTLNQLNFNFDYNDLRSDGSVLINYENLKLTSLTKEKESTPNEFKSWIINTFLKKDKDKSVSKEKRTGIIDIERERKRAIIQFWVKSLFSGLKSSVLDSPSKKKDK